MIYKKVFTRRINKRSMKNFNHNTWNEALSSKDWSKVKNETNVEDMAKEFDKLIAETLDEVAPFRSFTVKSHYKFGLSDETKCLMQKRDQTRKNISTAGPNEKQTLLNNR